MVLAQNRPFNQQKQTTEEATWGMGTPRGALQLGGALRVRAERERHLVPIQLLFQVDKMPPKFVSDGHLDRLDSASPVRKKNTLFIINTWNKTSFNIFLSWTFKLLPRSGVHFKHAFCSLNNGKLDDFYKVETKKKLGEGSYGQALSTSSPPSPSPAPSQSLLKN